MGTPHVLADRCVFTTTTTGTAAISVGAAATGFRTPAGAGLVGGERVLYRIDDGAEPAAFWEHGEGVYNGGGTPTLSRVAFVEAHDGSGTFLNLAPGTKRVTILPLAHALALLDSDGMLHSVTPPGGENSGIVATTQWVKAITDLLAVANNPTLFGTVTISTLLTAGSINVNALTAGQAAIGTVTGTVGIFSSATVDALNAGTVTATTAAIDTAVIDDVTGTVATYAVLSAGGQTIQAQAGLSPFPYVIRAPDGKVIAAWVDDTWFFRDVVVAGDITMRGEVASPGSATTPGMPEHAYDVTRSGAVGDGSDEWFYLTWSASSATLSAYTFRGAVTIASGSRELSIDLTELSGVAFQRGRNEGWPIAVEGAGVAGGILITTIAKVKNGSVVELADAASTTVSAATKSVMWPCFTTSSSGMTFRLEAAMGRGYWIRTAGPTLTQYRDDTDVAIQPFLAFVSAYVSPFSVTLDRNLPGTATAAVRRMTWGTDNTQAISDAGNAMAAEQKGILWFPGAGIYCAFRLRGGSSEYGPQGGIVAIDNTIGEGNQQQPAMLDAVWQTGRARGVFFTSSGDASYLRLVPADAPPIPRAPRHVHGPKTLAAFSTQAAPIVMIMGDSVGTYDPSRQDQAGTPATLFHGALLAPNFDRAITILPRAMGGATWAEQACDGATRASVNEKYPWYTNTTASWISYALGASPVPDVLALAHHAINDQLSFHPIHVFSAIKRMRSLVTRGGQSPDILLEGSPHNAVSYKPKLFQSERMQEGACGFYRGLHVRYGYGLIDYEGPSMASLWGFDPTRPIRRRIPAFSHVLSPSSPLVIPADTRSWRARIVLTGVSGAAVWAAIGTLRVRLSQRPDNVLELSTNGSGLLTYRIQTWGATVASTLTTSGATLQSTGQSAFTADVYWANARSSIQIGAEGSGPLNSGHNGKCLWLPSGDYDAQPQRTFIEKAITGTDSMARVHDYGAWDGGDFDANATVYIGGMMFLAHDGNSKADIRIVSGGNSHQTTVSSASSRTQCTLTAAWPHGPLSSAAGTVFLGHESVPTTASAFNAAGDAGADPYIEISVNGTHLLVRYCLGSIRNDVDGRPAEVPAVIDAMVLRFGGPYLPVIECSGAGLTVAVDNLWVDDDTVGLYSRPGTQRFLRGAQDDLATSEDEKNTSLHGGDGPHPGGVFAHYVIQPTLEAQDFAA
jgi:hypothetical protein